jgi:hypothetical protein
VFAGHASRWGSKCPGSCLQTLQATVSRNGKRILRTGFSDFFDQDFQIANQFIGVAEEWNGRCDNDKTVLITKGDINYSSSGIISCGAIDSIL